MRYKCAIIKVIDIVVDILGRGFMMDPKRKRLYMIIGAVIAIVIAVAAGYLYYMRTPTYTLRTIGNAVKTHDWASFQKHVDVKGIFNNIMRIEFFTSSCKYIPYFIYEFILP